MGSRWAQIAAFGCVLAGFAAWCGSSVQAADYAAKPEFYTTRVKPVLDANCGRCHEGANHRGGLNMDTRDALLKGGHHGAAIVPGDPSTSMMVKLMNHAGPADDPMDMPPNKPKLSDADIKTVSDWIKAGAVMPAGQ